MEEKKQKLHSPIVENYLLECYLDFQSLSYIDKDSLVCEMIHIYSSSLGFNQELLSRKLYDPQADRVVVILARDKINKSLSGTVYLCFYQYEYLENDHSSNNQYIIAMGALAINPNNRNEKLGIVLNDAIKDITLKIYHNKNLLWAQPYYSPFSFYFTLKGCTAAAPSLFSKQYNDLEKFYDKLQGVLPIRGSKELGKRHLYRVFLPSDRIHVYNLNQEKNIPSMAKLFLKETGFDPNVGIFVVNVIRLQKNNTLNIEAGDYTLQRVYVGEIKYILASRNGLLPKI
ncbi:hypothetical protein SteCoe_6545 [Stentor coeruleus]|uniref:Uncharacterized protein n=1 Tax=Stentor coeruleus TaxID=5963 RepID=A0A1R2CPP2_9CILI|nr:hypothetical protein SteCoe_6545 [Stentor coeruleus]